MRGVSSIKLDEESVAYGERNSMDEEIIKRFEEIGLKEVEKNLATNRYSPGTLKHGLAQWFINSKRYEGQQKQFGVKFRLAQISIWISGGALLVSIISLVVSFIKK